MMFCCHLKWLLSYFCGCHRSYGDVAEDDDNVQQDSTEQFRALCEASAVRLPLGTQAEVEAAFRTPGTIGVLNNPLADEIRTLVSSPTRTGFDTHDLRRIGNSFQLERAIGQSDQHWDAVVDAILYPLRAGTELALRLARDLVAALDVEPYNQFTTIDPAPKRIEALLRQLALFDHLSALRQWRLSDTEFLLRNFFATDHQELMKGRLGWDVADVIELVNSVTPFADNDPSIFTRGALQRARGMGRDLLNTMVPHFVHAQGEANRGYTSPLAASDNDFNLMFKPLINLGNDRLMLPAGSLAGPAFYEATMTAMRGLIRSREVSKLQGDGTERAMLALLRRANLNVTFVGAKYNLGAPVNASGECDTVIESDTHIVFAETKAKALTRGAMAGVPGDALIDFGAAMLATQAQALRHERVLRTVGSITFEDGRVLQLRGREVIRLSLTLLDQGALQDRMVLWSLFDALRIARIATSPDHPKAEQINGLNEALDKMCFEVGALEAEGRRIQALKLATASLSLGQLAILLENVTDLAQFAQRIALPLTFMSFNPILEFYRLQRAGTVT